MELVDALTVCRICLQNNEETMVSIYEKDSSNFSLYEKIEMCTGIKMTDDPSFPTRICHKCTVFLALAFKFRVICINSNNYLKSYVGDRKYYENDEEEDNDLIEYLYEDAPAPVSHGVVTKILQPDGHNIIEEAVEFDDGDIVTEELWVPEDGDENEIIRDDGCDDIIEMDMSGDTKLMEIKSEFTESPSKTLGISSDGAAVIRSVRKQKKKELHICEICGNVYPRKTTLEGHMRRHRNERRYECELCHDKFFFNFQLIRHIRKHTGARPYTCQYCQRRFTDRSTQLKHERIHRNERPYKCEVCDKTFTYASVLKVHKITHTGEKPFSCGICGKRFARNHQLRAHLETLLHSKDPRTKLLLQDIKPEEGFYPDENAND